MFMCVLKSYVVLYCTFRVTLGRTFCAGLKSSHAGVPGPDISDKNMFFPLL